MAMTFPLPMVRSRWTVAADLLDETSEAAKHEVERNRIAADVRELLPYVKIEHPTDGEMSFVAWGWQLGMLLLWMVERLVVVLKARQLGVSWLGAIFALWTAAFRSGQKVLIISTGQNEANQFLAKVLYVLERLPAWLRPRYNESTTRIEFPDLHSEIEALPATKRTGRSLTASLVILDEHGHQELADMIYLALKPAVEFGKVLAMSSANGIGALHSRIYRKVKQTQKMMRVNLPDKTPVPMYVSAGVGENNYRAVFVPASAHPGRQGDWRTKARAELEDLGELSDAKFAQEYPENDEEAFITTGRPVFRPQDTDAQKVEDGQPGEPGTVIYRAPAQGVTYLIGADVGEGLERSDWSSAGVFERDTMEQVAQMRGRWSPDVYATKLDHLARLYGKHAASLYDSRVILAVERNNHGHAVLLRLQQLHGDVAPYTIYRAKDKRAGWLTSPATRPVMVDELEAAIRLGNMAVHDAVTIGQMAAFSWQDDGRAEAQQGHFDDDVMAAAIAWQVRRRSFGRVLDVRQEEKAAA